jgi:hypothetical protein
MVMKVFWDDWSLVMITVVMTIFLTSKDCYESDNIEDRDIDNLKKFRISQHTHQLKNLNIYSSSCFFFDILLFCFDCLFFYFLSIFNEIKISVLKSSHLLFAHVFPFPTIPSLSHTVTFRHPTLYDTFYQ